MATAQASSYTLTFEIIIVVRRNETSMKTCDGTNYVKVLMFYLESVEMHEKNRQSKDILY